MGVLSIKGTCSLFCNHWKVRSSAMLLAMLTWALVFSPYTQPPEASGVAFQTGDVLAGVGNGRIKHFSPDGTLLDTLDTEAGSTEDTGMAFDAAGNLYATVFQANNLYKFDNTGNRIGPFGSGYNQDPESIVFDKIGHAYVGQADGSRQILKFDSAGTLIDTYSPQREDRGTDWIDLAADQCTLHYTSEGSSIKHFNICTRTQLPDFATGLSGPCYGHRIRPNFEELVACTSQVYRLNSSGGVIQTYHLPGTSLLFALNLDPDNKTFWTADLFDGTVFRIDIATGTIIKQFDAGIFQTLAGLAVVGELTAATTVPPPTTSYYVATQNSDTLARMGRNLAKTQIAGGTAQDSAVALLFGAPTLTANGQDGVTGFLPSGSISLATVEGLVEDFAEGYYNGLGNCSLTTTHSCGSNVDCAVPTCPGCQVGETCLKHPTLHARIIIATSNGVTARGHCSLTTTQRCETNVDCAPAKCTRCKVGETCGSHVTQSHGQAWAQMVNNVASYVVSHKYAGQLDVAGGSNIEVNTDAWENGRRMWADAEHTRAWVIGYNSVHPHRFMYDVGNAICPTSGITDTPLPCEPGWTQDDVWYVSWGADSSEPFPESYSTTNAAQWAALSLYSRLRYQDNMIVAGSLTQVQACCSDQTDRTCAALSARADFQSCCTQLQSDLTITVPAAASCNPLVAEGWRILYDRLNVVVQRCDAGTRVGHICTTDDTNATTGCPGATCPRCCIQGATVQTLSWSTDIRRHH